jgi:TrmH family RNA methyltransferase
MNSRPKKPASQSGNSYERLRSIEGKHNALVKELRTAFSRGELTPDGYCAIEGVRIVEEAIRSGLKFRAVFFSKAGKNKSERLLPQLAAYVEALLLPDKLFASVVPSESPQGVAALVKCRPFTLDEVLAKVQNGPLLAIAGVQDPGNLGTMLRSAEAFEACGVVLGEGTANPFNSKVVRASAGSVFRLPMVRANLARSLDTLREHGLRLFATSSHKGVPVHDMKFDGPAAIFIGSEGAGLPRELISEMDEMIAIPHSTNVESLNAGVAASIVMYEVARQRG